MPAGREWITRAGAQTVLCLLLTALTAGRVPAPTAPLELRVSAGLDGVTKPGRWTPVRIALTAPPLSGRALLIVEWGAASIHRHLEIVAGASQQYELYLQTMEVGAAVTARLVADGEELGTATAPIRTLRADEPFTVCVLANDIATNGECTVRPAAATLPRSLRGYDAADRVIVPEADDAGLTGEQRSALARWHMLKALDDSGSLSATDRPRSIMPALSRKAKTGTPLRIGIGLYVCALLGTGLAVAARRLRAPAALAAVVLVVVAGSGAAIAAGRNGWPSSIVIHHATLVQQLGAAHASIVTMQGAVEFPANDRAAVHALVSDGAFGAADGWPRQTLDESGHPRISGTYGLGQRQPFMLSAVADFAPLLVVRRGAAVVVTNTSADDLSECRFANDAPAAADGVLRAGASVSVDLADPLIGPVITCTLPTPPVGFSADPREIRTNGRTVLVAYLTAANGPGR